MKQKSNGRTLQWWHFQCVRYAFPHVEFVMLISLTDTTIFSVSTVLLVSKQIETVADEASSLQFINTTIAHTDRHTIITTSTKIRYAFEGVSLFADA